ncbi:MAG: YciI family protein, partial [Acidobacteriota bacterium]|nr:YciI family protein [Acidobacteriota bacterium]
RSRPLHGEVMRQRHIPVVLLVACLAAGLLLAEEPEYEMTTYQFVLLWRADLRPMSEREIQKVQELRLAYLEGLFAEGKAIIGGSIDRGGDLQSVLVLDTGSIEAAEAVMEKDPAVATGRFKPEIHAFWAAKNIIGKPESLTRQTRCYLGLIKRPGVVPDYSDEELEEIQAGHMANIQKMADSGDLVWAGPMADDGDLRGIFVFRTLDPDRLKELVARDPGVKAGRFGVELYPWHVPEGSIPKSD